MLVDDFIPILRHHYSFNRNIFRDNIFQGMQRPSNTTRIPSHPLLNRQTNRPAQSQPPQQHQGPQSSYLRVSDPQSVLQLVSSNRSSVLPDPGVRPLPGQWRRLVLEQDQLVFEEDPLLHKEQNLESQDNEDESFIPMCNLRIYQEDGMLGSCHNFQSIKKAQEEIAAYLREESEKEKQKEREEQELSANRIGPVRKSRSLQRREEHPYPSILPADISPPPLPHPDTIHLTSISIPSPSEQPAILSISEPSTEQSAAASLNTQLPTDDPLLFNQFDGSQRSARQTLQQIDSNHPLYTFFSAVAGDPPPPNPLVPISPSTGAASASATMLLQDTSTVQLTAPPTVTALERPREGPAGDTSHVPPDTNLPLHRLLSVPFQSITTNTLSPAGPYPSSSQIFAPIAPNLELPGSDNNTPGSDPSHDAPTSSGDANPPASSHTEGEDSATPTPPSPIAARPVLLRSIGSYSYSL